MPFWQFQKSPTTPVNEDGSSKDARHEDAREDEYDGSGAAQSDNAFDTLIAKVTSRSEFDHATSQTGEESATTGGIAQELRRQYASLLRSREEMGNARLEAQEALQQSNTLRRWCRESQRKLKHNIQGKGHENEFDQDYFISLCNTAIADSNKADAQATTANVLQGKLSIYESRVRDREIAFVETLDRLLRATGVWHSTRLDEVSTTLPRTPSPSIDPRLEAFYISKGDVGLIGEEIADLDIAYQEALSLRALRDDQGSPPSESESHYEREFKTSRTGLESKLRDAIAASEEARNQCLRADIDPDAALQDEPLDDFALPGPLVAPGLREQQHYTERPEAPTAPSPHSGIQERNQAMVLEWASQLPAVNRQTPVLLGTDEAADGETPIPRVTQDEVDVMNRFELDKWGYMHVQRPRRHSSVSHLRWKGNEANKMLEICDDLK